jgi:hypothetical protein
VKPLLKAVSVRIKQAASHSVRQILILNLAVLKAQDVTKTDTQKIRADRDGKF